MNSQKWQERRKKVLLQIKQIWSRDTMNINIDLVNAQVWYTKDGGEAPAYIIPASL